MSKSKLMTADEIFEKAMATMAPLPSQESCARDLCAIFSYHLVKTKLMDAGFGADELPQQHAIMVAPTGAGKTYLLKHIAKVCDVNMIFMDGSNMTREGWKGATFSQQLLTARNALQNPVKFANSILFVDEADKMSLRPDGNNGGNVMDNLLQLFNGGEVAVESEDRQVDTIDISRFTIIMGGAFAGLEDIIRKRITPKAKIGFGSASADKEVDERALLQFATPEDLQAYGMKKELIARLGSVININPLGIEDYRRLLTAEVGSVQANYRNLFSYGYGVDFDVTDEAVRRIAEQCSKATTGARAMTPIVNAVMREGIATIDRDKSINKVLLSADETGCCLRYEHGPRSTDCIGRVELNSKSPHRLPGESIETVLNQFCEEYQAVGADPAFVPEFKAFLGTALAYIDATCRPSEFNLDNLRKLACAAHKAKRNHTSPFDIIITDQLLNSPHHSPLSVHYEAFTKLWSRDTAQRISKALTLIRQRMVAEHNSSFIVFNTFTKQSAG